MTTKPEKLTHIWLARKVGRQTSMLCKQYRLREMRTTYGQYIKSIHWKTFKQKYIKQLGGTQCEIWNCSQTGVILHHRTYERLGYERFEDVALVCYKCHDEIHKLSRRLPGAVRRKRKSASETVQLSGQYLVQQSSARWSETYIPVNTLGDSRYYLPWAGFFQRRLVSPNT